MDSASERDWAVRQLLDPLTAPDPASEDGPGGSHFGNTMAGNGDRRSTARVEPEKKDGLPTRTRSLHSKTSESMYPTPPASASPSKSKFPEYRDDHFGSIAPSSPRQSSEIPTSTVPTATASVAGESMHRRRGSSLSARFPGDRSHRPLDILREENKAANRHYRKTSIPSADSIDQLGGMDINGALYHHDGPYDATLLSRNLNPKYSPVAATFRTNQEAIRATPPEFIRDSVHGHRPLAGVASVPPGEPDRYGRVMHYKEGPNLNVEMGYRRWEGPGITYHPDDIKGKGEPSYTIEKALKDHKKSHRRVISESGIELRERPRASSNPFAPQRSSHLRTASGVNGVEDAEPDQAQADSTGVGLRRSHTTGKRTAGMSDALRSRFGSLRRRKPVEMQTPSGVNDSQIALLAKE